MNIKLTVVKGPKPGQVFDFDSHDTFVVGRSRRAHFRLPSADQRLSRMHFMVDLNPPLCRVIDLGSHNGTLVNGERVSNCDLHDGDIIRAGRTEISVTIEEEIDGLATTMFKSRDEQHHKSEKSARRNLQRNDSTVSEPPPIPGYDLIRPLGRGGMGVVYLALRKSDNVKVAIKTIKPMVEITEAE